MIYGIIYIAGGIITLFIAAFFIWRQMVSEDPNRKG